MGKADCRAAMMRLCVSIPLTVHEPVFVCPEHGDACDKKGAIAAVWIASSGAESVPILVGAKQGKDRDDYVAHLKSIAELLEAEKAQESAQE